VELWDFGSVDYQNTGPRNCVSYSYQYPFNRRFAADGTKSAAFAVMSDRNPWMDSKIRKGTPSDYDWKKRVGYIVWNDAVRGDRDWQLQVGNSPTHQREGQNVLFADGHSSYEVRTDVGVTHDNMFTPQGTGPSSTDSIRIGQMPDPYGIGYGEPARSTDSFLVNDDEIYPCFGDQPGDLNGDCTVDAADLAILSRYWMESTRVED
jgi:prepilin-type processing-associated H-X9-DG protein